MKEQLSMNNDAGRYNSKHNQIRRKLLADISFSKQSKRPEFNSKSANTSQIEDVEYKVNKRSLYKLAHMTFNLKPDTAVTLK